MIRLPTIRLATVWFASLSGFACSGTISGSATPAASTSGPGPGGQGSAPGAPVADDSASVPGPTQARRLTILEYNNTVRDLLGVTSNPARDFGVDQDAGLSGFTKGGPVTTANDADEFYLAAEGISQTVLPRLPTLLPCGGVPAASADQDACARQFIVQFGRRAFRRPLTSEEVDDLFALYGAHRGPDIGDAFPDAMGAVLSAMLQAPQFLYRWELGTQAPLRVGNVVRFGPNEMASRLSYLFWASMPDDQLFQAADQGKLSTPEQIEQQARRLLKDPRAKDAIGDFHVQWLDVDGLPVVAKDSSFTDYSPAVAQSMLAETREFASQVVLDGIPGGLTALLTSSTSYIDESLANIYGVPNVSGTALRPVALDPTQRSGVLTQGSFLTEHASAVDSHPIKRGMTLYRQLMCTDFEQPANVDVGEVTPPAPGVTTRQRYAMHAQNPCATCHQISDPVGFAFENYDAIGAYRTTDEGQPVDASGSMNLDGTSFKFDNAIQLSRGLAASQEVQDCVVTQWFRYALRREEVPTETASLNLVKQVFTRSSLDFSELLVAIVKSRSFDYRTPAPGEVLP